MAFDFPASPTTNQTFTPPGGPTYVWNGTVWLLSQDLTKSGVITSDTPPPQPVPGQLWFQSSTGNTYIWYVDVDSAAWVQFNVAPPRTGGVILPEQAGGPATLADQGAIYAKDVAAKTELFFRTDTSGSETQITKADGQLSGRRGRSPTRELRSMTGQFRPTLTCSKSRLSLSSTAQ